MRPHLVEYPNSSYDEDALRTGYAEVCEQICAALLGNEDKVDFDPYSPYWIGHLLDRLWGADWHDNLYLDVLLNLAADERLPALEVFAPDSGVIDRIIDGSIRTILVDAPAPTGMEAYPEAEIHVGMEAYADSTPVTVPVPPDDPGRYEDYLHTLCQVVAFILRNGGDGESARWETLEHWFPYLFGEDWQFRPVHAAFARSLWSTMGSTTFPHEVLDKSADTIVATAVAELRSPATHLLDEYGLLRSAVGAAATAVEEQVSYLRDAMTEIHRLLRAEIQVLGADRTMAAWENEVFYLITVAHLNAVPAESMPSVLQVGEQTWYAADPLLAQLYLEAYQLGGQAGDPAEVFDPDGAYAQALIERVVAALTPADGPGTPPYPHGSQEAAEPDEAVIDGALDRAVDVAGRALEEGEADQLREVLRKELRDEPLSPVEEALYERVEPLLREAGLIEDD